LEKAKKGDTASLVSGFSEELRKGKKKKIICPECGEEIELG